MSRREEYIEASENIEKDVKFSILEKKYQALLDKTLMIGYHGGCEREITILRDIIQDLKIDLERNFVVLYSVQECRPHENSIFIYLSLNKEKARSFLANNAKQRHLVLFEEDIYGDRKDEKFYRECSKKQDWLNLSKIFIVQLHALPLDSEMIW